MKSWKKLMALLVGVMIFATACGGNGNGGDSGQENQAQSIDEVDSIVIGGLAPLTGSVAVYGTTASNGAKLAIEEINANGGIAGKEVRFNLEDEKGDPQEAVNAYNKLVQEGIHALLGDITSGPTIAVAELAKEDNLPMLTPTGTQLDITEGRPNVFRVCFTDPFQGETLAQYIAENLKAKTVAIMTNNSSDYSKGVAESFKAKAQELGVEIVGDVSYGEGDSDFRAQLTSIAGNNPDVLMIPDYYEKIALIAPQARETGINGTLIGPDGWDGVIQQVDQGSLDTVENAVFTNHYSADDQSEKVQNFIKAYKEKYNEDPSSFAALAYDGIYMLKDAIENANSLDRQAIVDAMKAIDFQGVTGKIKFDDQNNPIKSVSMIKIVKDQYTLDSVVEPK